ncbi:arylalcohol dehydrogenase [Gymnopus androsaceus JB14]|uniref:Arylalcohol dehydrogenase n=1 Tax=Gymnopus androsaceus JB14 TaxID=1447944 RepID=A0A6A4I2W4_9AGAR|nr:arylalcohol dehydrogenase [Gymnopus androsaceus JB14]
MSSIFSPAPEPSTKLGVYCLLSPRAGMSIGDDESWNKFMGSMDKERSMKLLDAYYNMGGNFINTANLYQNGTSEMLIGEWMEKRGNRDQMVIATKYSANFKHGNSTVKQQINYIGNNAKSLHLSVEASLKKLRTDYIDILYVHVWDCETSVEEVVDSLHNLVVSGKVIYLGISDTPAWVVAHANTYAREKGKTPFVIYQGEWNIMKHLFERDIIPMVRSFGLALAPWDEEEEQRRATGKQGRSTFGKERTEDEVKMSHALEKVAKDIGAKSTSAVAIAYVMHKTPYVFPIIALSITLTDEKIQELESVLPFDVGFPSSFIGDGSRLLSTTAKTQRMPYPKGTGALCLVV